MTHVRILLCCACCLYLILAIGCKRHNTSDTAPVDAEARQAAIEAMFAEFDAKAAALPYQPIVTTEDGVLELADANFMEAVNEGGILVVDFWMDGCPPCEDMVPVIKGLARLYAGKVRFGKLHYNSNMIMTEKYQVQAFPTFLIFVDGKPTGILTGAQPATRFQMLLDKTLLEYQAKSVM
ncbi:MAG: thioredoxin family protein [Planctomycetaceae bacterium]|nr:thioredoxin family protein [Planctomycetaceae bacterium]